MSLAPLAALGAIALAAFATEGAIGFGGTVIAASLGAQLVPLERLLPAFVPLNLVLSSYLLSRGLRVVAWRMLAVEIAPPVAAGAAVGLGLFHLPGKAWMEVAFGVFVVGLAVLQLARPDPEEGAPARPLARGYRIVLLVLGGIAHGLFGTGGPMIVYVVRRRLPDKLAFRSTLAVLWLVLNVALLANFATAHLYDRAVAEKLVVIAAVIVPGLLIGDRVHHRLPADRFERAVWILLLAAGAALAIRSALTLL